jgi:hypothetical protein
VRTKWVAKLLLGLSLSISIALVESAGAATTNLVRPSLGTPLNTQMHAVWDAVASGSFNQAAKYFFPGAAYVQMKQGVLPNPSGDFATRLLAFFKLDVTAYHQLLIQGGPSKFIGIRVNPLQVSRIQPGVCENKIGYWHLGPVRVVYEQAGVTKSFAIASLISWNGEWKIIHLGPNPRPHNVGTVDSPQKGAGTPGPGGGC